MKLKILLTTGLLIITVLSSPTIAVGGECPAFTSSMIDVAALASEYNQPEPVEGLAEDYPNEPYIRCYFYNENWGRFSIFVGFYEDELSSGSEAYVYGSSPFYRDTVLLTHRYGLSKAELRACRAQVVASFTWKQYCAPLIQ